MNERITELKLGQVWDKFLARQNHSNGYRPVK